MKKNNPNPALLPAPARGRTLPAALGVAFCLDRKSVV